MFRSQLFDHLKRVVFSVYFCYYLLCFFASSSRLFGMWLYVVCVYACLMYLSVVMFGCDTTKYHHKIPYGLAWDLT
jgi:hypothetical protein